MSELEIPDVHLNDYEHDLEDKRLICRNGRIKHINEANEERHVVTIPPEKITSIRIDTDHSETGFRKLAAFYFIVAVTFSSISYLFLQQGRPLNVITGGSYAISLLSWYAVISFATQDVGKLLILTVDTENDRYLFISNFEEGKFATVQSHLQESVEGIDAQ